MVTHELRQILRDGRFWGVAALMTALLLSSGVFGWNHASAVQAERAEAQRTSEAQWADQGEKNPHAAAHYGIYVFKPTGALSFFDPGVESSLGVTVKLQAHKRSSLQGAASQDSTALDAFGRLSPAAILQLILPLLIIGLGFTAWSAERERGTLRQIMSYGVAPPRLLQGKLLGLGAALGLLTLPALLVAIGGALWAPPAPPLGRAAALLAVYGLYMGAYLLGAIAVSARAPSSRDALVLLLGFWGLTSLIVPRLAGDLIDAAVPMPAAATFAAELSEHMERGLPGGPGREARVEELLGDLLKREGFSGEGGMMMMQGSLLQGMELEAEAAFEREVIDHHFNRLAERTRLQDTATQCVALLSPFVAIRSLSMGLAGTDLAHHQHFARRAESYRRELVSQLNREFAERGGVDGWAYRANRALWEKAPPFTYAPPPLAWAAQRQAISAGALALWFTLVCVAAWASARRLKVG